MTDNIVTRLRNIARLRGDMSGHVIPLACIEAASDIERLRWQLMHAIYCPVKTCSICADIEKEVSNEFQPAQKSDLEEMKDQIREYNISQNWYSKPGYDKNSTPEKFIENITERDK